MQWRDLTERFGPWKTVHKRLLKWSADGTWERLLQQIQAAADAAGDIDWDISVDSTVVRAHHHAASARKALPPPRRSKGEQAMGHQIEPAGSGLAAHLVEVVRKVKGWAGRAAGSPPRFT